MRYTEYHAGKAVIKDRKLLPGAMEKLAAYENTGEKITALKERDTEKAPEIHENKRSSVYTCPSCNLVLINKDEKGWFCGEHYKFCPDCGQRIKWEN